MASATIIDVPTLPVKEQLKIVALQGDWPLHIDHSAEGGRYVVATPARAKDACLRLVEHARDAHAHLALVPELAIPLSAVEAVIDRIRALTESLVFVGGLEGCSLNSYRDLVQRHGGAPDIPPKGHGTYVNAMMIVSHTPEGDTVSFRAKRFASGPENALGPQMTDGAGPFLILRLGSLPFTVLPLICSEFVWPIVWDTLTTEAPKLDIDVIPVLQRNHDPSRKHLSPILYGHYQKGAQTRFVMVNHSLAPDKSSDGSCYVFLPPGSPAAPGFDHGREELWLDGDNYKGFRIPDRTGCFWEATVVHRSGPTGATKPPLCSGRVLQVLLPPSDDLSGLPAGLLRSAAAETLLEAGASIPLPDSPKEAYLRALDRTSASHLLHGLGRTAAGEVFLNMICEDHPTWMSVEALVRELVDCVALIACCGEAVRLAPGPGGNCIVNDRVLACLYAPVVDAALVGRFPLRDVLSGAPLPAALVLLQVDEGSRSPRARTVGDVLRSDRISSGSLDLTDAPTRSPHGAVTIRADDIYFCVPSDLRPGLSESSSSDARARICDLLPGVFA